MNRNNIEPNNVLKCLEKQDNKRSADLRKYYIKNIFSKEKGLRKNSKFIKYKWKNIYPIAKALEYLPINDRAKLLFVSKDWNCLLENKILKSLLVKQYNNREIDKKRISLWLCILKYVLNNHLFNKTD